jgi:hypothetical protein
MYLGKFRRRHQDRPSCAADPNKDSYTPDTAPVARPSAVAIGAHSAYILSSS